MQRGVYRPGGRGRIRQGRIFSASAAPQASITIVPGHRHSAPEGFDPASEEVEGARKRVRTARTKESDTHTQIDAPELVRWESGGGTQKFVEVKPRYLPTAARGASGVTAGRVVQNGGVRALATGVKWVLACVLCT